LCYYGGVYMKRYLIIVIMLLSIAAVNALSNPVTVNGKTYYTVTSTDLTEDTGFKVCSKAGLVCVGYTDATNAACKAFHTSAADSSSLSGDKSGVYCNGAPQSGVCSALTDTCHVCPKCTNTVDCNTAIGGLYREMYVECAPQGPNNPCNFNFKAANTQAAINLIPAVNAQLKMCPLVLPASLTKFAKDGNVQVDIKMNSGQTQSYMATIAGGKVTSVGPASGTCNQRFTTTEADADVILKAGNQVGAIVFFVGSGRIQLASCTTWQKITQFFSKPVIKIIAKKVAPTQPAPAPPPNCGNVGEQCNNRGCFSGICGAPKEQNIDGAWGYWNYQCLAQSSWDANCQGHGNTPPSWQCLTGPCG